MARGERRNADYFPFYCKEGKTTKYIETTYGNDGFAVWVKLLRQLTVENYHYLDLSSEPDLMILCSTCRVSEELLLKIIDDLVKFREFDADLWQKDRIVWSDKFVDSIEDAYKNRKNKIVKRDEFIRVYEDLTGKKLISGGITYVRNTQSKEENTKEEKTREDTPAEVWPLDDELVKKSAFLLDELCEYFSIKQIVTSNIYDSVSEYCSTVANRGQIDAAIISLEKYKAYKARSLEQIHNPFRWIGTHEKHFQDGVWITIDWQEKLSKYDATHNKQQHQGTTTAASATIESGKGFGDFGSYRKNRTNGK